MQQAEELKRHYGNAVVTAVPQLAEIEIANPSRAGCRCAKLRRSWTPARELLYYVKESLRQGAVLEALGPGVCLPAAGPCCRECWT